ncbi:hypothetical protein F66182_9110 [Fusarium sp. NRRL 66182]|nr:hypothetical protein F66182_9110 [Fusarium sp. NRRL 66182]
MTQLSPAYESANTPNSYQFTFPTRRGDYLVQVSWPLSWNETRVPPRDDAHVSTVYIVDGNAYFFTAADIARRLELTHTTRAVLVALGYPNRDSIFDQRRNGDLTPEASAGVYDAPPIPNGNSSLEPYGGASDFLDIIENDIQPYIEDTLFPHAPLKTSPKALFGHSYGGLFALNALFTKPSAFDTFIAASPSIWFNNESIVREQEQQFNKLEPPTGRAPRLMVMYGGAEQTLIRQPGESDKDFDVAQENAMRWKMKDNAVALAARMEKSPHLRGVWQCEFQEEDHGSAAHFLKTFSTSTIKPGELVILVWPLTALYRRPWPISSAVAPRLDPSVPVEEEETPNYYAGRFYPVHLGQVFNGRYQIATKLGYGANSTIWLARDLDRWRWSQEKYVAIKVNATSRPSRRVPPENELDIMRHISQVNPQHRGWHFIRKLSDSFTLETSSGTHSCLVLEALREPLWLYRRRSHYLKPDNVMVKIEDASILERDAQDEFDNPLPQKHMDARTIYLSRNNYGPFSIPAGIIQIVDFDLSVRTKPGQVHTGAIQGEMYRAPEVILDAGYTYSADIWSLGVMLWDLLEGKGLFNPTAPDNADEYDDQAHLGQITALIGHPPPSLLSSGQRTCMFYNPSGELKDPDRIPSAFNFENSISCIRGEEKQRFIQFINRMVKWSPEERNTARELLDDPWLYKDFSQD